MILISCVSSHFPKKPCKPKRTTNIKPATTGETENGRSMSVTRAGLPGNLNFAIAHAAAKPKRTFSGTLIAVTINVKRIAAQESGWANDRQ